MAATTQPQTPLASSLPAALAFVAFVRSRRSFAFCAAALYEKCSGFFFSFCFSSKSSTDAAATLRRWVALVASWLKYLNIPFFILVVGGRARGVRLRAAPVHYDRFSRSDTSGSDVTLSLYDPHLLI